MKLLYCKIFCHLPDYFAIPAAVPEIVLSPLFIVPAPAPLKLLEPLNPPLPAISERHWPFVVSQDIGVKSAVSPSPVHVTGLVSTGFSV